MLRVNFRVGLVMMTGATVGVSGCGGVHLTPLQNSVQNSTAPTVANASAPPQWKSIHNLSESIFHVQSDMSNPAHLNFAFSFYNLDKISDAGTPEIEYFRLSADLPEGKITSDKPEFAGSTLTCNSPCTTGTWSVTYQTPNDFTKLRGTAVVNFNHTSLTHITPGYAGVDNSAGLEDDFVKSFQKSAFLSATLTLFTIQNGLVHPFAIEIHERDPDGIDDLLYLAADNIGNKQDLDLSYVRSLNGTDAAEHLKPHANILLEDTGRVDFQFVDTLTNLKTLTVW